MRTVAAATDTRDARRMLETSASMASAADCGQRPTASLTTTKTIQRQQTITTYQTDRTSGLCHVLRSVCLFVCPFVFLSVPLTQETHGRTSPNSLCMLPVAVPRSFSGGIAMRYVLPVLWRQLARIKQEVMFRRSSPGGGTSWTSGYRQDI